MKFAARRSAAAFLAFAFTCFSLVAVAQTPIPMTESRPSPAPPVTPASAAPPASTAMPASSQLRFAAPSPQSGNSNLLKPATAAQTSDATQTDKPREDASHQGITVHGHWIIDVRNPDGTLAEHRDFQNSLVGANDMLGFLYGSEVMSDFAIYLGSSTPACNVSSAYYCDLVHNLSVLPASARCGYDYCVTGLTITPTFGNSPALVLAGNLTATQAGTISTVGTFIGICGTPSSTLTTTSAASCAAGNNGYGYGALTQTTITAINIVSGQIVQVSVTITFS